MINTVFVCLSSVYPSACQVTYPDFCMSVHLSICPSICLLFSLSQFGNIARLFYTFPETMQYFPKTIYTLKKRPYTLSQHSTSGLGHTRGLCLHHRQCWPQKNTPDISPKLCVHKPSSFLHSQSNIFHSHREENSVVAFKRQD